MSSDPSSPTSEQPLNAGSADPLAAAGPRSRRRRRLVMLVAALLAGPVIGYYCGARTTPWRGIFGNSPSYELNAPRYRAVGITDLQQQRESRGTQIDDARIVDTFHSLFTADDAHRLESAGKIRRLYMLKFDFKSPAGSSANSSEWIDVWESPTGLVWTDGQADYRLHGELPDWLAALPAIRTAQLLSSHEPGDREIGVELRAAEGETFVAALLKLLDSENPQFRNCAIHHLASLVRIRRQPPQWNYGWQLFRDQRRSLDAPLATEVSRKLTAWLQKPPPVPVGAEFERSYWDSGRIYDCLVETGDQSTANELAALISRSSNDYGLDRLLTSFESLYGLPPTYQRRGTCGNSSEEEFARFRIAENARRDAARTQLMAWHAAHATEPRAAQLDAVLDAWGPKLTEFTASRLHSDVPYPTSARLFNPLWRVGPELLPAIERKQQGAKDLSERGAWEFLKAYLAADCDASLVNELLAGDLPQQRLACQIIGVSGRRDWTKQLEASLRHKLSDARPGTFYDVQTLTEAAAAALRLTLGLDSLPLLRQARREGFSNRHSESLIAQHDLPASR